MHERDRRRTPATGRPAVQRPAKPDYTESKSYQTFVSKKLSVILGIIFVLNGAFACVDYYGPREISHEKILGFPGASNYFLIRTDKSYFVIDPRLQHETPKLHDVPIDVEKSFLNKIPLAFTLPETAPGEKFYPLSTRYSYLWLFMLSGVAGLVLIFYPKKDFSKIYLIVFSVIIFVCSIISALALQMTINGIYAEKTLGW